MSDPVNYVEMMDKFAQDMYEMIRPKSETQPVVIEEVVSVFKELRDWAVKRNEIINSESSGGGAISEYQKGISEGGNNVRESRVDAAEPSSSTGILTQLGTRRKSKKPSRLPTYIEGDVSDSGGAGSEQPVVSVNGGGLLSRLDGDSRPDSSETLGSGDV